MDITAYIWYNINIKYRRCFYGWTVTETNTKSIHKNIWVGGFQRQSVRQLKELVDFGFVYDELIENIISIKGVMQYHLSGWSNTASKINLYGFIKMEDEMELRKE